MPQNFENLRRGVGLVDDLLMTVDRLRVAVQQFGQFVQAGAGRLHPRTVVAFPEKQGVPLGNPRPRHLVDHQQQLPRSFDAPLMAGTTAQLIR